MRLLHALLPALLLALPATAPAAEAPRPPDTGLVSLQAEVRAGLANDLLVASLYLEQTDRDPARLAAAVSRAMNEAMALRKAFPDVTFTSGGQSTWPVYDKDNRQDGWRTRASLRLESRDFAAAAQAIARLQPALQLEQVSFTASPAAVSAVEDRLLADAIKAFSARADIAARALGKPRWELVNLHVNGGGMPPPVPMMRKGLAMMAETAAAPQEFAGGDTTVTMSVNGTIRVLP